MSEDDDTVRRSRAALRILRHFNENPEAQDSLEGIAHWWMLSQELDEQLTQVQAGLSHLLAAGLVMEVRSPGSEPRYRLDPLQAQRVRALLAGAEEPR